MSCLESDMHVKPLGLAPGFGSFALIGFDHELADHWADQSFANNAVYKKRMT